MAILNWSSANNFIPTKKCQANAVFTFTYLPTTIELTPLKRFSVFAFYQTIMVKTKIPSDIYKLDSVQFFSHLSIVPVECRQQFQTKLAVCQRIVGVDIKSKLKCPIAPHWSSRTIIRSFSKTYNEGIDHRLSSHETKDDDFK